MGRPPIARGLSAHVIRRGVNRCDIYRDNDDRKKFLSILRRAAEAHAVAIHAFVLMTTHYHLLLTPTDGESLAAMMKRLGERYVRYFNRKHSRVGTLWTNRYSAIPIEGERRWWTCHRYIEQNPVRARMVAGAHLYPWSSCRAHAFGPEIAWLVEHDLYRSLGANDGERRAAYRAICAIDLSADELWIERHPPLLIAVQS